VRSSRPVNDPGARDGKLRVDAVSPPSLLERDPSWEPEPNAMVRRRRQEDTDIDQYLYPALDNVGIPRLNIRRNIATTASGRMRGDLWVADVPHSDPQFDRRILALIECKDRGTSLDDIDWLDAKEIGRAHV